MFTCSEKTTCLGSDMEGEDGKEGSAGGREVKDIAGINVGDRSIKGMSGGNGTLFMTCYVRTVIALVACGFKKMVTGTLLCFSYTIHSFAVFAVSYEAYIARNL